MSAVLVGSRWKPGYVERRDSETGYFEAVNSPIYTRAEVEVQRALLAPVSKFVEQRIAEAQAATHATPGDQS